MTRTRKLDYLTVVLLNGLEVEQLKLSQKGIASSNHHEYKFSVLCYASFELLFSCYEFILRETKKSVLSIFLK